MKEREGSGCWIDSFCPLAHDIRSFSLSLFVSLPSFHSLCPSLSLPGFLSLCLISRQSDQSGSNISSYIFIFSRKRCCPCSPCGIHEGTSTRSRGKYHTEGQTGHRVNQRPGRSWSMSRRNCPETRSSRVCLRPFFVLSKVLPRQISMISSAGGL